MTPADLESLPEVLTVPCCPGKGCTTEVSPRPCVVLRGGEYAVGVEFVRLSNGDRVVVFYDLQRAVEWVSWSALRWGHGEECAEGRR